MRIFCLSALLSLFASCATHSDHAPKVGKSFTGYNSFGEGLTCYVVSDAKCAEPNAEAAAFREACKAKKGSYGRCDCDNYLCSVP